MSLSSRDVVDERRGDSGMVVDLYPIPFDSRYLGADQPCGGEWPVFDNYIFANSDGGVPPQVVRMNLCSHHCSLRYGGVWISNFGSLEQQHSDVPFVGDVPSVEPRWVLPSRAAQTLCRCASSLWLVLRSDLCASLSVLCC